MKHKVDIVLVLRRTIEVEAEYEDEAQDIAYRKFDDEYMDFADFDVNRDYADFTVARPNEKAYMAVK